MMMVGGFGWLGVVVPLAILIAGGSLGDRIQTADRSRKAGRIQLELARASLGATERARAARTRRRPGWRCARRRGTGGDGHPPPHGRGWSRTAIRGPAPRSSRCSTASSRTCAGSCRRPTWPPCGASATARRSPSRDRRAARPDRPRDVAAAPDLHRLPAGRAGPLHRAAVGPGLGAGARRPIRSAGAGRAAGADREPTRRDGHPLLSARGRRAAQPRAVRRRQPSPGPVPGTARRTCHQRGRAGIGRRAGAGPRPRGIGDMGTAATRERERA